MKRLFTIIAPVLLSAVIWAQSPQKMSYQAVIRNSSDQLVTNHAVGMRISILQGSPTGALIWTETCNPNPQTNANGLVSIEIGAINPLSIDWSTSGPYFLKTETDPTGGTNYTITGTSQLLSVPYAIYSKKAGTADYNSLTNLPNLSGYLTSESDPVFGASPAQSILSSNITDWNSAFGWGNHVGLYRPVAWVPSWTDITGKPTFAVVATTGNYNDLINLPNLFNGTWASVTGKPTTLSGYGITDAVATTGNQTIAGNKTFTGITTVSTPVNATDAATKAYVDALLERIEILEGSKVKDKDGNVYSTVIIGDQFWMAENLKTTKYKDGTTIPLVTINSDWSSLTTPGYCWYANNEATYKNTYGALYNWYTVNTGKLCPTGWHVPSDAEWTTLTTYLGGVSVAGGKLKETGTTHWLSPNTGATNETGFTALPGGNRYDDGLFIDIRKYGYWWSTNFAGTTEYSWGRYANSFSSEVGRNGYSVKNGFSVRCLKDN